MKITQVKINGMTNPVGFDFSIVKVSWKVEEFSAPKMSYAKIEVSEEPSFSTIIYFKEGRDLKSYGEKLEMQLQPYTRYYVRVTVTASDGRQVTGDPVYFETAKMEEPWTGKWIGTAEEDTFHPQFGRTFTTGGAVASARLYICGLGLYEAYLNGEKIGDEYLAPFFNDYNFDVQYQTYDVTAALAAKADGEQKIEVILGNGWYKGRYSLRPEGKNGLYGHRFALIAEIRILYKDGSVDVIGTDETWKYKGSDVEDSGIYDGEIFNHLLWCKNDPNPEKAAVLYNPKHNLLPRYSMPVGVNETLPVKEIIQTPAGETVLDFGQNYSGYVSFTADLPAGTRVQLDYGEVLQQGNFYNGNYRTATGGFTYISDGRKEVVRPHFTFFGGRYVRVTLSSLPQEDGAASACPTSAEFAGRADFTGNVVYSRLDRTGYLETSDAKVNQLISNCLWGQKSNFIDVPTDCPQRDERLGWTGDANVFSPTASFNMDTRAFYNKYMHDLRVAQNQLDGAGPNVAPLAGDFACGGCVWGDVLTFLPDTVYEYYGDADMLRKNYPMMKDWVDYITRESRKNGDHHLYDFGFHYADWLALDGMTEQSVFGATDSTFIASCYYYASAKKVEKAAEICGFADDAAYYKSLAEQIREAIFFQYYSPAGRLTVDTQTAYYIALKFGLYIDREVLIRSLKERLHRDGYRIKGGFVGSTMMCTVLAENGFEEEALRFLTNEEYPGWLHCVDLGATTIWERWNSLLEDGSISGTGMNSLNHYSYGSVLEYIYRDLAGFHPTSPAFASMEIRPQITGRFAYVNGSYDSVSGRYVCSWKIAKDGSVSVHVEIPFNCSARLILPESGMEAISLTAGSYDYEYRPQKDYCRMFTDDSLCLDYKKSPEAMELLQKELPNIYSDIVSGNLETLSGPISPFVWQIGGIDPHIFGVKAKLNEIRYPWFA